MRFFSLFFLLTQYHQHTNNSFCTHKRRSLEVCTNAIPFKWLSRIEFPLQGDCSDHKKYFFSVCRPNFLYQKRRSTPAGACRHLLVSLHSRKQSLRPFDGAEDRSVKPGQSQFVVTQIEQPAKTFCRSPDRASEISVVPLVVLYNVLRIRQHQTSL